MKRIVTLQDISCLGRCSITVALPVISAMGHECAILPTAVLSTHTMFQGFTCLDTSSEVAPISRHWLDQGISFDAIYTGYLASENQCAQAVDFIRSFRNDKNLVVVDPAMADKGKLYPAFGESFPAAMAQVCAQADLILPNLTEAALLTGTPYKENWTAPEVMELLKKLLALGCKSALISGFGGVPGETGFMAMDQEGKTMSYSHPLLPHSFHGTGDLFASTLVGGLLRGMSLPRAGALAADYVALCIESTAASPDASWYGVEFEKELPWLINKLQ